MTAIDVIPEKRAVVDRKKPLTPKRIALKAIQYSLLAFFTAFFMIPIYVVLVTSLKPLKDISLQRMWELPTSIDFTNYALAFEKLAPSLGNSLLLVIPGAIIAVFLGSINGYVLSKWQFPGSNLVFTLILFGMFIPYQAILIPLVQTINQLGLYGTIPGLILVHVVYGLPITTLIFRNYYMSVPDELVEAALMDGSGLIKTYFLIIVPISIPAFIVGLIWEFTSIWNDFLFAVVLTTPDSWPVTVALNNIAGSQIVEWNVQMSGALLASLPTVLVYIFLGRYFLKGMMTGSLKG
jgi:glucose/mannose transport system permease protein